MDLRRALESVRHLSQPLRDHPHLLIPGCLDYDRLVAAGRGIRAEDDAGVLPGAVGVLRLLTVVLLDGEVAAATGVLNLAVLDEDRLSCPASLGMQAEEPAGAVRHPSVQRLTAR